MQKVAIFWFRRDLRLEDNAGLSHALRSGMPVLPLFILDTEILGRLRDRTDARVGFIHQTLQHLQAQLAVRGSGLLVKVGRPLKVWQEVLDAYEVGGIYLNRDYEPEAIARDSAVRALAMGRGIPVHDFKDHVIFDQDEVVKDDGQPYTVFTPFAKRWKAKLQEQATLPFPIQDEAFFRCAPFPLPGLEAFGFRPSSVPIPPSEVSETAIRQYAAYRDHLAVDGTSRLGVHLRFGTISIRGLVRQASEYSETFLNELIWREFFSMILQHFPHVVEEAFRPAYDKIPWRKDEEQFQAWCEGRTGYPLVDAGMRELNATGFMHNRARMITASFLCKHLLLHWRLGETYFAEKLLDLELASNNGNWQWVAGCGTDAAPYFRIFSPQAQQAKFDPKGEYIRRWVPEYGTPSYPPPIVVDKLARSRCLEVYKGALGRNP